MIEVPTRSRHGRFSINVPSHSLRSTNSCECSARLPWHDLRTGRRSVCPSEMDRLPDGKSAGARDEALMPVVRQWNTQGVSPFLTNLETNL